MAEFKLLEKSRARFLCPVPFPCIGDTVRVFSPDDHTITYYIHITSF